MGRIVHLYKNLLVVSNNRAQQSRHSVVWYLINVRWFKCLTVMQPYQEHGLILRFYLMYYLIFHNSVVLLPNRIRLEISLLVKSLAGEKANCSFSCSFCCFHFTVLLELHLLCVLGADIQWYLIFLLLYCSVREVCGKEDIDIAYKHFKAFYQTFSSVDRKLNVD